MGKSRVEIKFSAEKADTGHSEPTYHNIQHNLQLGTFKNMSRQVIHSGTLLK